MVFLFCALLNVVSSFVIVMLGKRPPVPFTYTLITFGYCVSVSIQCFFFMVTWVDLHCVIVAFPGHGHLFYLD